MEPASGGGPLAALVTASAAQLLADIARASRDHWPDARGVAAQAESLRDRATPLADLTAQAYEHALGAEGGDYELGRAYADAAENEASYRDHHAIIDALAPFGVTHLEMPFKPEKLWRLIQAAKK